MEGAQTQALQQSKAWQWAVPLTVGAVALGVLYRPLLPSLWAVPLSGETNESLGVFALALAAWLVWQRRHVLQATPRRTDPQGLWLLLLGAVLALLGYRLIMRFLLAVSLPCLVAGTVWWLYGRRWVAHLWFPILLLMAVAPLPLDLVGAIAFRLQNIVARLATFLVGVLGVPVERVGVTLFIGKHAVQVSEACSGWHTFSAAAWLFLILLYWLHTDRWWRWLWVLPFLLPLAVLANTLRVTTVALGMASGQYWVGQSPWHELLGIGYFLALSLGLMRGLMGMSNATSVDLTATAPAPPTPIHRPLWVWAAALWAVVALATVLVWQGQRAMAHYSLPTFPPRLSSWVKVSATDDDAQDGEWFNHAEYRSPDRKRTARAFLHLPLSAVKRPKRLLNLWLGMGYELLSTKTETITAPRGTVPLQLAYFVKGRDRVVVAVTYLHPTKTATSPVSARLKRMWEQLLYGAPRPWVTVGVAAGDEPTALALGRALVAYTDTWLAASGQPVQMRGGRRR